MPEQVAIDNDFLQHLLEIKRHPNLYDLICRFFCALDVSAWMHPLVYQNEAEGHLNAIGEKLFSDGMIGTKDISEIWGGTAAGQQYYETMVKQIYHDFTGNAYPCQNVCTEWRRSMSFGEVHTVVMCAFLMWDCFLSDDKKAAEDLSGILQSRMTHAINVYNRENRCTYLKGKATEARCGLTSSELNYLGHSRCN